MLSQGKKTLLGISYIPKVFGVYFTYIQNSKEAYTEDTEIHAEIIISCWESFQCGENVFLQNKKKQKKKIKPNFFKIFYFYIFGSSLFLCLFEKIYCGGILKSITSSNTNFEN